MRKLYALLFLFGLLTIIFGAIIVSGVHKLAHYMDEPNSVVLHPDMDKDALLKKSIEEHAILHAKGQGHDHGQGYHKHGSTLTFLLKSFDYRNITSLLQDIEHALLCILHLPGILKDYGSFLELNLPIMVKNSIVYFVDSHISTQLDIPTPPPRIMLS